jgi:hypothetical protein
VQDRRAGTSASHELIQCYAPTNDSSDVDKDDLYCKLEAETEKMPHHNLLVIVGDLNAKVGKDNIDYERVMGKHWVGARNENGERLVEFCAINDPMIEVLSSHGDIHKLTWNSQMEGTRTRLIT